MLAVYCADDVRDRSDAEPLGSQRPQEDTMPTQRHNPAITRPHTCCSECRKAADDDLGFAIALYIGWVLGFVAMVYLYL